MYLKNIVVLIALIVAASALESDADFLVFLARFGRRIGTVEEYNFRKEIFQATQKFIEEHNATEASFTLAHNRMSDWTEEEYESILTYRPEEDREIPDEFFDQDEFVAFPNVDWRDEGYVTPVKDQGQCGSCWAFSATGGAEGAIFKKTQELVSLSESNLVDCEQQSSGCNGGLQIYAFQYMIDNGVNTEEDYPYHARQLRCKFDDSNRVLKITKYHEMTKNNSDVLYDVLSTEGPISVAVDAHGYEFRNYSKGVFHVYHKKNILDHATLVVGYGTDDGKDYWIMKNSWSDNWGIEGYMWVQVTQDHNGEGTIGIQMDPVYPIA